MEINKLRTIEKNRLLNEIRLNKIYNKNDTESINHFRYLKFTTFNKDAVEKLKDTISERASKLCELDDRLQDVIDGYVDEELMNEVKVSTKETQEKHKMFRYRKEVAKKEQAVKEIISRKYNKMSRQHSRDVKYREKNLNRSYDYYLKQCSKIPTYMKKNLRDMSSNKGYIWRGLWLFGEAREQRNNKTLMMFEKNRGTLVIHEITKYNHKIYEKNNKTRKKKFIQNITLNPKKLDNSGLSDYL